MNRSILIIIAVAVGFTGLLYSLPKVVVNSQERKLTAERDKPTAQSDTNTKPSPSSPVHTAPFTAAQEQELKRLQATYQAASTKVGRIKSAGLLSDWYVKVKQFDSSAKYTEIVAQLDPTMAHFLQAGDRYYDAYGFAMNEKRVNELGEKTRQWYQKALDKNPDLVAAKANMAMTYVSTNNPMQGIMLLREVLSSDPTNELALFNLGMLAMRSNQYEKALDRFRQVLRTNPLNTKARFYLGVSLAQAGKAKEALEELATVKKTEKDPTIQAAIRELEQELNKK